MLLLKRDTGISACSLYTFLASNLELVPPGGVSDGGVF